MDWRFVLDMINAVKLELYRYRVLAAITFMVVTAGVLVMGYVTPKSYTSQSVLFADSSSILQPLLRGSAEVTPIDRINEARELLQSRSFLEQVAYDAGLLKGGESEQQQSGVIGGLRNALNMRVSNRNFITLSYRSDDPDRSFRVLSTTLNRFLERTVSRKRAESQGAYEFIDSQVKAYQRQLEAAEQRLKEFRSNNQDGTEANVQGRIERLRSDIENLKLEIQQTESEVTLTREQLAKEQPYRSFNVNPGQSDIDIRLAQIEELEERKSRDGGSRRSGVVNEVVENPVYETLRLKLSEAETRLQVHRNRLVSLERLLDESFSRAERVAANQAELSELTRDYNVTKGVYEDMLQRREKARLSMTLDVEGQGVSYRIQEPASYPARWDGLQLYQVGMAGPFLGGSMVLGLLVALVMFDNRIRSSRTLATQLPESIPLLAAIPHYNSTWKERLLRWDMMVIIGILAVFMVGYLSVMVFSIMGVEPAQIINKLTGLFSGQSS